MGNRAAWCWAKTRAGVCTLGRAHRSEISDRSRAGEAGYTLIELLVVITIIGMLVGLVGPRVLGYLADSKTKTARIQIQGFAAAIDLYYLDNGRYPTSSEGLAALVKKPEAASTWNGPYLKASAVPNDPWGRSYVYRFPGEHGSYDIMSLGPEGRDGAADSAAVVANWQQ